MYAPTTLEVKKLFFFEAIVLKHEKIFILLFSIVFQLV